MSKRADEPRKLVRNAMSGSDGMDKALRDFNRHLQTLTFALLALDIDVPDLNPKVEALRDLQGQMSVIMTQIDEQLVRWHEAL